MRALMLGVVLAATASFAQPVEATSVAQPEILISTESAFTIAAGLCLARVLGDDPTGEHFDEGLKPASDAARAGHPFGSDPTLRETAFPTDGAVTVRFDDRTCSVFAVGAAPVAAFENLATTLQSRGGFTEQEIRRRPQEGRVQRTFRQDGGRVRVEMEGFVGGMDAFPGGGDLAMVHIGRR